jgi:Mg-chelatase subunit ChlD
MNPVSKELAKAVAKNLKSGEAPREAAMTAMLRDAIEQASKPLQDGGAYGSGSGYARLVVEAQAASNLRQQTARVLKRSDKDSWARRLSAGRIDRRAYGRMASGDYSNPFARHTFSPGYETEIIVILDGSDSMSIGLKLQRAASLALVVAQAAEQVGVKCEVTRFIGHRVVSIKAARERLSSPAVQARFAGAAGSTQGSTPLTQTIALCAKRLMLRAPTKRKMIFCVTDGVCDFGVKGVRLVADHCDAMGVEIIGLSIDSMVNGAFKFESRVDSSDDVAKAGLGVLVKALENRPGYASAK